MAGRSPGKFRRGRSVLFLLTLAALVAALLPPLTASSAAGDPKPVLQGDGHAILDHDARAGRVRPTPAQRAIVRKLGATVRWNRFGTPASLFRQKGYLGTDLSLNEERAARTWLTRHRVLLRLSRGAVQRLELLRTSEVGPGRTLLFRQQFGSYAAGFDGLLSIAVRTGKIVYVSSTISGARGVTNSIRLSPQEAIAAAVRDVGRDLRASDVSVVRSRNGVTALEAKGLDGALVSRVALPTPRDGARVAYETFIQDNTVHPLAVTHFVDAEVGDVLLRYDRVDYLDAESPEWKVFPNTPPLDYSSADTRELWCWDATDGCEYVISNSALDAISPNPWDVLPPAAASTFTSNGNNARTVENWFSSNPFTKGTRFATASPTREYDYPWTNQWNEQRCNPSVFTSAEQNDIDAAIANLFAMHNRMHDWSYHLGFTEANWNLQSFNYSGQGLGNDPEKGNAQAGGVVGGPPSFLARDNANQITGPEGDPFPGVPGGETITNMYLWQPIAGAFYAPCVDGDYDMSVIGHEYTHAISNRMVAGPNAGLSGRSSRAMGESWSDLTAMEYLNEYGYAPVGGENPYAVGAYVTQNPETGIRNYGMDASPLNFSDVGYDMVCNEPSTVACVAKTQVHADGEIWSAVNFDIREAMNARYGSGDAASQVSCAEGLTPVGDCPGNRRWMQLVFDAYLLMATSTPTMLDARDAMIASDVTRFGGANGDLLWSVFAANGFGEGAIQVNSDDADPTPSFRSPHADEATVHFAPADLEGNPIANAQLFVGHYQARVTPVADTNPATPLGDSVQLVAGTYDLIARADGFGMNRLTLTVGAGEQVELGVGMPPNFASKTRGATATGSGTNFDKLIDDTEATNWADLGPGPVGGKSVTVRLDPSKPWHQISRVQVSALLRPQEPADPGGDTGGQNRFTALRKFEIWTCMVKQGVDCTQDSQFAKVFTSPDDAFPAALPRPTAPDLIMRSFPIPKHRATYVRLVVVTNQCTGTPEYQGDQDDDPLNTTDCEDGSVQDTLVRAAELQVFQK